MKRPLLALAAALSVLASPEPAKAQSYPIDCAILLCLAGGWPASVPCTRARAEFMRRITPWPVEPPLQIWRCPMHAAYAPRDAEPPGARIYAIAAPAFPKRPQSYGDFILPTLAPPPPEYRVSGSATHGLHQTEEEPRRAILHLAQAVGQGADIDISGRAFDFVRSTRVWHVEFYRHNLSNRHNTCRELHRIQLGTYGTQGDYRWSRATPQMVPAWMGMSRACNPGSFLPGGRRRMDRSSRQPGP